jgi:ABC-type multidrug transport system ATPase subunit
VFKDITYSVEIDGEDVGCLQKKQKLKKTLLQRVSGVCRQGEVTAIMGPSGAGKTTLLNVLACRIIAESGELLSNGRPYDYDSFGNFANYVMQTDVLMETLTVRETL